MSDEKFRDRFRRFCRYHKIDIVHNFFSPPITSRNIDKQHVIVRGEVRTQAFRFRCDLAELKIAGVLRSLLNGRGNLRLSRLAEARQFRDVARFTSLSQCID